MNWAAYKRTCDEPDVVSRWMLEQTSELLATAEWDLSDALKRVLQNGVPLPRPADHKGGRATEMFRLELSGAAARRICDCVVTAAAAEIETNGTHGRGLGGFVEAWQEFAAATHKSTKNVKGG